MEWPKRARTADWVSGVLTLDGEKQFEVPELTAEIMERLAGYTLVGFHVKGYPVTDDLLSPFAGHKNMANFGVEDGALTDGCFPVFSAMPKLCYLLLDGNAVIHGSGLAALQGCKLDLLTLNCTGLYDAGLLQAAAIPKLSHIQIDNTAVTYEGLLVIWEKYVSEKPRPGYRPLGLSYSAQGTYKEEEFLDAEQITRNKLYIYTWEKNTGFDRRFLMKRVGDDWKINAVQERLDGWQRTGL